jgi:hypothetical protein
MKHSIIRAATAWAGAYAPAGGQTGAARAASAPGVRAAPVFTHSRSLRVTERTRYV